MWQLPPRQIERCFTILLMLKKGLGQELRRISHGPAIRHHHPLRFGLQLGRHGSEPSRNVDRRCSLRAGNDRLNFSASRIAYMLRNQSTYRGYAITVEHKSGVWFITASPKTSDLPILRCYFSKARAQSEADAMAEAKYRVDKVLAA
jgi:hypothetical protein